MDCPCASNDDSKANESRDELGGTPPADAFARDTLDADLGHAIPDRPAIYEEAVRRKENRFTGHVHMVYGKFHPDSVEEARTRVHLDWYATEERMLLVEKSKWMRRAWTIDRRSHEVVEHALMGDEVIQRPPLLGRTYPPNYRAGDTLEALGRDTIMLGLPCTLYRDPASGARLVVATDNTLPLAGPVRLRHALPEACRHRHTVVAAGRRHRAPRLLPRLDMVWTMV